ncbi:MAG: IS200/IS605 family transposase [Desulfitobacteriaceae bacterium]|nr:IS200/IS605 family transposase [Desulfitobacteriaceae bacterium]
MELHRNRNSVFNIGYHVVWCVKYRHPVLEGEIASDLAELMQKTAAEHSFSLEEMEIMPDHVHLFVRATPSHFIPDMIKALKGVSARFLFQKHPELKKRLWGGHLWNPSYYVGTVGHISEETVRNYIESQKSGE